MGTNYYVSTVDDPDEDGPLHIGKSSVGWRFTFHECVVGEAVLNSTGAWRRFLAMIDTAPGSPIEDEYGRSISVMELFDLIERKKDGLYDGRPDEVAHFHQGEFC